MNEHNGRDWRKRSNNWQGQFLPAMCSHASSKSDIFSWNNALINKSVQGTQSHLFWCLHSPEFSNFSRISRIFKVCIMEAHSRGCVRGRVTRVRDTCQNVAEVSVDLDDEDDSAKEVGIQICDSEWSAGWLSHRKWGTRLLCAISTSRFQAFVQNIPVQCIVFASVFRFFLDSSFIGMLRADWGFGVVIMIVACRTFIHGWFTTHCLTLLFVSFIWQVRREVDEAVIEKPEVNPW